MSETAWDVAEDGVRNVSIVRCPPSGAEVPSRLATLRCFCMELIQQKHARAREEGEKGKEETEGEEKAKKKDKERGRKKEKTKQKKTQKEDM